MTDGVPGDEVEFDLIADDEPLDFPGQTTYQRMDKEKPCYICKRVMTNQAMILKRDYMPICSICTAGLSREPRIGS